MMNQRHGFTGPVNIGNPDEFTIAELAKLAIELAGSSSKVVIKARASGRSSASQTKHRSREKSPRMGAAHRAARRPRKNHRAFPRRTPAACPIESTSISGLVDCASARVATKIKM